MNPIYRAVDTTKCFSAPVFNNTCEVTSRCVVAHPDHVLQIRTIVTGRRRDAQTIEIPYTSRKAYGYLVVQATPLGKEASLLGFIVLFMCFYYSGRSNSAEEIAFLESTLVEGTFDFLLFY